jgi:anti-sigma factor RsiW
MFDHDQSVTEEELHAYVDGELAPERREAVEAWLATHSDDMARVGAWRAQAEAIRSRYGAVASEPVPARFDVANLAMEEHRGRSCTCVPHRGLRGLVRPRPLARSGE